MAAPPPDLATDLARLEARAGEAAEFLRLLANEKKAFRDIENRATVAHFARMRQGSLASSETSALHLDLLRDLKSINSHLVAAAAYPILERARELLPDRLRIDD